MKVCEAVNTTTNECIEWVDMVNPFIPSMTAAEGQEIGWAIFVAFVLIRVIMLSAKAIEQRQD